MRGFLIRTGITALGLWIAQALVPSITFAGVGTLVAASFLLGIVNAIVRPILIILTLPITLLTLGLFLWVINAGMLALVSVLLSGFQLGGFWPALFGSFIVAATSWIASWYVGPSGQIEVMVVRRDRHRLR
ncbi:MAG: phage holin family protein [Myxococcota bacterium]